MQRRAITILRKSYIYKPRTIVISASRYSSIPNDLLVEEETLRNYKRREFYPAKIGEFLQDRYKILGKLGYGSFSTVWLCRDEVHKTYKAVKISTGRTLRANHVVREDRIYENLSYIDPDHLGAQYIRKLDDSFEVLGRSMIETLGKPFDLVTIKGISKYVLQALDFLHSEAKVVHGDIRADNIMISMDDPSVFTRFVEAEKKHPTPRKHIDKDKTIFISRDMPDPESYGAAVLCDFGEACINGVKIWNGYIQPCIYRAPEVVLKLPWTTPIDIWNFGCFVFFLVENKQLFDDIFDPDNTYNGYRHMAQLVGLLGKPPSSLVARGDVARHSFDGDGNWMWEKDWPPPQQRIEDLVTQLEGDDKEEFVIFLRSTLQWEPEKRKTAGELLADPWLRRKQ